MVVTEANSNRAKKQTNETCFQFDINDKDKNNVRLGRIIISFVLKYGYSCKRDKWLR